MSNQQTHTAQTEHVRDTPSETWGDKLKQKDNNTFRIYFQNINGIQPHQQERWANIIQTTTTEFEADIIGLCETGLNWKEHYTRQKVQNTLRNSNNKNINIYHSKNTATSFTSFLPGGTLLLTNQSWIGRIVQPLHDPDQMGRWTGAKYRLQENRNLFVLSAYRPCPSTTSTILPQSNSTFAQQFFKMRIQGIVVPNPREQFVTDIIQFIHDLKLGPNDMILLMFDANEHIGKEKNGIINIIEKAGLVDLFPMHHSTPCNIATQVKGSQRIDYILGSQNILPYIQHCGYLPFHTQLVTDHRGMYLDLCSSLIDVTAIGKMNIGREIGSSSTMNKTLQYKEYIYQQFQHHNIQQRAEDLHIQSKLPREQRPLHFIRNLNLLDQAITQLMLTAEQKYAEDPLKRWITNETIRQLYSILKYWQIKISEIKNKKDFSGPLNKIRKNIREKYHEHLLEYNESPKKGLSIIKQELLKEKKLKLQEIRDQEAAESAMIAQAENTSEINIQQKRAQIKYTRSIFANLRSRFK